MPSIMVVDDELDLLKALGMILRSRGYQVRTVSNGNEAVSTLESESFDLLVADVRIGNYDGLELLDFAVKQAPGMPVIMITAYATLDIALAAIKSGAFDFLTKPFPTEALLDTVQRALDYPVCAEGMMVLDPPAHSPWLFEGIIARSEGMCNACRDIERLAPTSAPLQIVGERGCGRGLVAEVVHKLSKRRPRRLTALDCATLNESLLRAKVAETVDGTLLLEHPEKLSGELQEMLLHLVKHGELYSRSGAASEPADVRLIFSVGTDPVCDAVEFQEWLHALGVITVELPPLRERISDLFPLVSYLMAGLNASVENKSWRLTAEVYDAMEHYDWPGNVDELIEVLKRAVDGNVERIIRMENLPQSLVGAVCSHVSASRGAAAAEMRGLSFREYVRRKQKELSSVVRMGKRN